MPEPLRPVQQVRQVLEDSARLSVPVEELADDADLYAAGLSSHASVSVMLSLEDAFDIEFPDRMLTRSVFASIASMAAAVHELLDLTPAMPTGTAVAVPVA